MQQPLCHLYFLTVMEHLCSEENSLSSLVGVAIDVKKELETAVEGEAVLLSVELQAVIQALIQQLAKDFNPSKIGSIMEELNKLEK